MGIIKSFSGAIGGTFADQWKDIITAGYFDERTVLSPGVQKNTNNSRGSNTRGSEGIISNGSKIYVPENTAAFIFNQSAIEDIILTPGGYEYQDGEESIFNGDGFKKSIVNQTLDRFGYGGITSEQKQIAFINLRELRGIPFGTPGPQVYHDLFYGADLEIMAFGVFSLKVVDTSKFIRNFLPPNISHYSFNDAEARAQIISEFIQSFVVALTSLSKEYRISQLPAQASEIALRISSDNQNAGTWSERFGIQIVNIAIESIRFSDESRELVKQFNTNKMGLKAYEDVSQRASNIAAQQKIAQGIQDNGLGEGGGMIFGMNMGQNIVQNLGPNADTKSSMTLDEQIESVKKLKELFDAGILSQEEFDIKKKEIMGL